MAFCSRRHNSTRISRSVGTYARIRSHQTRRTFFLKIAKLQTLPVQPNSTSLCTRNLVATNDCSAAAFHVCLLPFSSLLHRSRGSPGALINLSFPSLSGCLNEARDLKGPERTKHYHIKREKTVSDSTINHHSSCPTHSIK